jgi:[protein-PII] uridylyltransferase
MASPVEIARMEPLKTRFLSDGQAAPLLRERTMQVDALVVSAFTRHLAGRFPDGLALLAVGGYGRRELFPYSDIDLLLMVKRPVEPGPGKEAISEFLRELWDSGLKVSQSVRPMEECCTLIDGNIELSVSLLDERLLTGDHLLYGTFRERFLRFLTGERRDLTRRLCRMARSRHAKFHNTIYRLEPDIKEAPGGFRDLQTSNWLRMLREAQPEEAGDAAAREFLGTVRAFLHFRAGRDANMLSFDAQDEIAETSFSRWPDPAEWMRNYFRHARAAHRDCLTELDAAESQDRGLLSQFRDWRSRLSNSEFTVSRDRLFVKNPHELQSDPQLALRVFTFIARHGIQLASETERRLQSALTSVAPAYLGRGAQGDFWRTLLPLPHAPQALRAMQDTGYLEAMIPEWEHIEHLVTRDFYHLYTVDEHTFVTLDHLALLAKNDEANDKRFSLLLSESEEQGWLLRMALLLHDIGKGSGKEHSSESVRLAGHVLDRLTLDESEREMVVFLIQHHLDLSSILQSRDLDAPDTAKYAVSKVPTIEKLKLLTVMTLADIGGVNPTAMSPWRREQLWRLYRVVARELTRGLSDERIEEHEESGWQPSSPEMTEFLEGLPKRYLWTHSPQQAEKHLELYQQSLQAGVALDITRREGIYTMVIVTEDRPFLLASLSGGLASFGLNILKADAFSNKRGMVVDTFAFSDPGRNLELNPPELERLKLTLAKVARGQERVEDLLKYRPVKAPPGKRNIVAPSVSVDDVSSAHSTVIEVVAQDRPGLLYSLATAISRAGCNIDVVLLDTEAHKAIDVFHVSKDGEKLDSTTAAELQAAMQAGCVG